MIISRLDKIIITTR